MTRKGYRVFISYSHADMSYKDRLVIHLRSLELVGIIQLWHDYKIEAGDLWREEIDRAMTEAEIALFLVSADFLNSRFCQHVEIPRMLERHKAGGVLIVPILIKPCNWKPIEWLSQFQFLPRENKPVTQHRPYDRAWTQVVGGIHDLITNRLLEQKLLPQLDDNDESRELDSKGLNARSIQEVLQYLPSEVGKLLARHEALRWLHSQFGYEDLRTIFGRYKTLRRISLKDARELLVYRDIRGSTRELDEAAEDLELNPVALTLAAEYAHSFADGAVADIKVIPLLSDKTNKGRAINSVLAAYEVALKHHGEALDLELLLLFGLFDYPIKLHYLRALSSPEPIDQTTVNVHQASDKELGESISRLRQWGMLAEPSSAKEPELQAYPWIREYFEQSFKRNNIAGWIAAHKRSYEHSSWVIENISEKLKNRDELTLNDLVLLSQTVSHGCKAGQHEEVLFNLFNRHILPAYGKGLYYHFSSNDVDAIVDLAVISSFFESLWDKPADNLSIESKLYVLDAAYLRLKSLDAETEAKEAMQARLKAAENMEPEAAPLYWYWYNLKALYDHEAELIEGEKEVQKLLAKVLLPNRNL